METDSTTILMLKSMIKAQIYLREATKAAEKGKKRTEKK